MRSDRAVDIEPRAAQFIFHDRIQRGAITIVAGLPDGGKSLLAIHIAAFVSRNADVVVSSAEDNAHQTVRPRLEAAGGDLERIHVLHRPGFPGDLGRLQELVVDRKAELVVIDPIAAHLGPGVSRFNDSMRRVTDPLADLAESSDAAIVVVEHTLKKVSPTAHPLAALGGGSSGLRAAARLAYLFGKDPGDDERAVMCCIKANAAAPPPPLAFLIDVVTYQGVDGREGTTGVLRPHGECEFDAMTLLTRQPTGGQVGRPPDKRVEAESWLCRYLFAAPEHQARATDVKEDALKVGHLNRTLDRAAEGYVVKFQRSREWWWRLTDETVTLMNATTHD